MNSRSDFFLPAEKKANALAALREHFGSASIRPETLRDALAFASFDAEEDKDGNVTDLLLSADRFDDDSAEALHVLAPFVRAGSYLMFIDEEACQWAWVFREHPSTHVVEALAELVIPVLVSEYQRWTRSSRTPEARSDGGVVQIVGGADDDECDGP